MKATLIKPMNYGIASEGLLRIDRVASGVGVIIFNTAEKHAAGIHLLRSEAGSANPENPAYYADTGIAYILQQLKAISTGSRFSVAIAGGASMLSMSNGKEEESGLVSFVKNILAKANLVVKIEEIGGKKIRSMLLNIDEGKIKIA